MIGYKVNFEDWESEIFQVSSIPDEEISLILAMLNKHSVVDTSIVTLENSKICVQSGPLVGMEDKIKKINFRKNRAYVELEFLGQKKYIQFGVEFVPRNTTGITNRCFGTLVERLPQNRDG